MTTDKYLTQQYTATNFNFPYVQAVRGEEDHSLCGYFIPLTQAEKAGWLNLNQTETIDYTYNNGEIETGILLTKPRMVICAVSQLSAFARAASQAENSLVVIGEWQREYKQDDNIGNFQIFLVMFLDAENQPLHDIPLKLVAKGAQQATLSEKWQQSCIRIARLHAKAHGVPFRPRDERYNALCVFEPIIKRKIVGKKAKSATCYIEDFVKPTEQNWQKFFLGTNELLADTVIEILNPQPRALLVSPSSGSTISLPPAAEELEVETINPNLLDIEAEQIPF